MERLHELVRGEETSYDSPRKCDSETSRDNPKHKAPTSEQESLIRQYPRESIWIERADEHVPEIGQKIQRRIYRNHDPEQPSQSEESNPEFRNTRRGPSKHNDQRNQERLQYRSYGRRHLSVQPAVQGAARFLIRSAEYRRRIRLLHLHCRCPHRVARPLSAGPHPRVLRHTTCMRVPRPAAKVPSRWSLAFRQTLFQPRALPMARPTTTK
jgi:hypothetical protein